MHMSAASRQIVSLAALMLLIDVSLASFICYGLPCM